VTGQDTADRLDPEALPVLVDERLDPEALPVLVDERLDPEALPVLVDERYERFDGRSSSESLVRHTCVTAAAVRQTRTGVYQDS